VDPSLRILADEWRIHADALARFTMARLVNRIDVWGAYLPSARRRVTAAGRVQAAFTAPFGKARGKEFLTHGTLVRHYASLDVGHLVGLHATAPDDTSRWFAVDVDLHDELDGEPSSARAANLSAVLAWWERLSARGFDPLLTDSNGAGGYHLLTVLAEPAPTPLVFALLQELVSDWARFGLVAAPETFPKKPRLEPGGAGAWLRLPGRHHTRQHWSRVWSGEGELEDAWLEGHGAVERILATRPAPLSAIPGAAREHAAVPSHALASTETPIVAAPPNALSNALSNARPLRQTERVTQVRRARPTICLDLDGVLARYDGWKGLDFLGDPLPGAVEFTRQLSALGDVVVFTTRTSVAANLDELRREPTLPWDSALGAVEAALPSFLEHKVRYWLEKFGFAFASVYVGQGKPPASAYIDDRAVSCRPQLDENAYGRALDEVRTLAKRGGAAKGPLAVRAVRDADPRIERLVAAWDALDEHARDEVLALVEARALVK